jgi:hypothetical protein
LHVPFCLLSFLSFLSFGTHSPFTNFFFLPQIHFPKTLNPPLHPFFHLFFLCHLLLLVLL